jgi:Holliday junction resolvase RusA-like endonuclease
VKAKKEHIEPPKHADLYVRPSWQTTLEGSLSYSTRSVLSAYRLAKMGHPELYLEINGKAPSANKMYAKQARIGERGTFFLDKSVKDFRDLVSATCWRKAFVPRGTVSAVIVFESPAWVTKEHRVRMKDVDNPVKTVLDALQRSLRMPDELVWETHTAKLLGRREVTHVWLFDIGEVVPAFSVHMAAKT